VVGQDLIYSLAQTGEGVLVSGVNHLYVQLSEVTLHLQEVRQRITLLPRIKADVWRDGG